MKEPVFLSVEQVLEIHRLQLESFGGLDGIRDQNALESAVATPQSGFGQRYLHSYPFGMAAAYAFHLSENQPFIDGNKRTALNSALTFLEVNGVPIRCQGNDLYQAMIEVGNRR